MVVKNTERDESIREAKLKSLQIYWITQSRIKIDNSSAFIGFSQCNNGHIFKYSMCTNIGNMFYQILQVKENKSLWIIIIVLTNKGNSF